MSSGAESGSTTGIFAQYLSGLPGRGSTESAAEIRARAAYASLLAMEGALLQSYFHLERAARVLFERTGRSKPRPGGRAARLVELERQRLGRELHTGVGQMLAAIRLQLERINALLSDPGPAVAQALDRIAMLTSEAHGQVRAVSSRLHPPEWQRLTLEEALRRLWEISGISQSFEGELQIEAFPTEPDLDVKALIYRAMQEALSNLVRHAGASRIDIVLAQRGSWLVLEARDNGVGFDPGARHGTTGAAAGIGLRAIREQAEELGGHLLVETGPSGTTLIVSVPHGKLSGW